ncbi:hypothetical protein OG216_46205 (plasmid) [Streptomycetaceae bacterium NBC_01309]
MADELDFGGTASTVTDLAKTALSGIAPVSFMREMIFEGNGYKRVVAAGLGLGLGMAMVP